MTYPVQFANLTAATGADLDQNFNAALPLAGGTMTGPLSGTSATFADPVAVGAATASGQAVQLGQVQNTAPIGASNFSSSATTASATTASFTAPSTGILVAVGIFASSTGLVANTITFSLGSGLDILSIQSAYSGTTQTGSIMVAYISMTVGQITTATFSCTQASSSDLAAGGFLLFFPLG